MSMFNCKACRHTVAKNLDNRCVYCGVDFEPERHVTSSEKSLLLAKKSRLDNKLKIRDNDRLREEVREITLGHHRLRRQHMTESPLGAATDILEYLLDHTRID